jgi:cytochrome P450
MRAYATKIEAIVEKTVARWAAQHSILFYEEVKRLLLDVAF